MGWHYNQISFELSYYAYEESVRFKLEEIDRLAESRKLGSDCQGNPGQKHRFSMRTEKGSLQS